MRHAQLWKIRGGKANGPLFPRGQRHFLFEHDLSDSAAELPGNLLSSGILQFRLYSQVGFSKQAPCEMRHHLWITNGYRPGGAQVDPTPKSHILVWRRRIPVHPVDSQIIGRLGGYFHCEHVREAVLCHFTHIKFVSAISPRYVVAIGDLATIHPDIRSVVDSVEMQPHMLPRKIRRQLEFRAIPPGTPEGAAFRHWQGRKVFADRIVGAGDGEQIPSEVRIEILLVSYQRHHYRCAY